jgi:hypothetical protein
VFVTMVQGMVAPDREGDLRAAWESNSEVAPPGLIESSLLRTESGEWRIVTVWESRDAELAMRAAGRPAALVMFEQAGSDPAVSMWTVEGRLRAT